MEYSPERSRRYRALAEEIRSSAEGMLDPEAQRTLLRLAESYELMADHAEALAQKPERKAQ